MFVATAQMESDYLDEAYSAKAPPLARRDQTSTLGAERPLSASMFTNWFVVLAAVAVAVSAGCSPGRAAVDAAGWDGSSETGAPAGDDRLFVPEGLPNINQDGQDMGLVLVALTLVPGASGPSFYAAVQNVFSTPLCEAGMMLQFYDQSGQLVGSAASVLASDHSYQLTDGSGAVIPCVAPQQIVMTGATDLPATIVVDQLGSLVHLFPSFNVDVVPTGELAAGGVQAVAGAGGTTYRGAVANQIGMNANNPSVAVFPVNRVGRPLGMATASTTAALAAGSTWTFETGAVDDPGVGQVAFASGSVP